MKIRQFFYYTGLLFFSFLHAAREIKSLKELALDVVEQNIHSRKYITAKDIALLKSCVKNNIFKPKHSFYQAALNKVAPPAQRIVKSLNMPMGEQQYTSPWGKYLLSCSGKDYHATLINLITQKQIILEDKGTIHAVAWSNNNKYIAVGSSRGTITLWECESLLKYPHPKKPYIKMKDTLCRTVIYLQFTPDDRYIVSRPPMQKELLVWSLTEKKIITSLQTPMMGTLFVHYINKDPQSPKLLVRSKAGARTKLYLNENLPIMRKKLATYFPHFLRISAKGVWENSKKKAPVECKILEIIKTIRSELLSLHHAENVICKNKNYQITEYVC